MIDSIYQWRRQLRSYKEISGVDIQGEQGAYTPPVRKIHTFLHKKIRKQWQAYTLVNLILKKITKIGATRCQILRLKCTKIDFGWGSAPDPAEGAYSAPPDPLAVFKGAYF